MTQVVENARLELLRALASFHDWLEGKRAKDVAEGKPDFWPTHTPLLEGEWQNDAADIILAYEECLKLDHVDGNPLHTDGNSAAARIVAAVRGGREWMVRITPAGYAWIRAHDLVGEVQQEATV